VDGEHEEIDEVDEEDLGEEWFGQVQVQSVRTGKDDCEILVMT
jgi:hypothetical protein